MTDTRTRLHALDQLDPPEMWDDAMRREPRTSFEPAGPSPSRKVVVIVTAFALTIAASGFAFYAFTSSDSGQPVAVRDDWVQGEVSRLGLSFRYPPDWHLQPFDEVIGQLGFVGVVVSDSDRTFNHPDRGPNTFTGEWDLTDLSSDAVVISIQHVEVPSGEPDRITDDVLPDPLGDAQSLTPTRFSGDTVGLSLEFRMNDRPLTALMYFGTEASVEDREVARDIVSSIEPTSRGSGPPSTIEPAPYEEFIPPTMTEGAVTVLPLIMPDGSRVEIAYPTSLRLAELGLTPQLLMHSSQGSSCGWDPSIRRGSLRDVIYGGDEPWTRIDGVSGPVEMWEGKSGWAPFYLVFEFGAWTVNVSCSQGVVPELASWAANLNGNVTDDGFLVLSSMAPIVLAEAGTDLDYGPGFILSDPDDRFGSIIELTVGTRCVGGESVERQPGWARRCVEMDDGAFQTTIQVDAAGPAADRFIDSVVDQLEVRSIQLVA